MMGTGYRHESGALQLFLFAETGHAELDAFLRANLAVRQVLTGVPDNPATHGRDRFMVALDMIRDADEALAADPRVQAAFALAAGFAVKIGRDTYLGRVFGNPATARLFVGPAGRNPHTRRQRQRDVPFDDFGKMFAHVALLVDAAVARAARIAERAAAVKVARAAFVQPHKVGDILTDHAPYGAARFYRVVKATRFTLTLVRVLTVEGPVEPLPTRVAMSDMTEVARFQFRQIGNTGVQPVLRVNRFYGRLYPYTGVVATHATESGVGK